MKGVVMKNAISRRLVVATHNAQEGNASALRSAKIYQALREKTGLDVLCVQENCRIGDTTVAGRLALAMQHPLYKALYNKDLKDPGCAILYDANQLVALKHFSIPLLRAEQLNLWGRIDATESEPKERHAHVGVFQKSYETPFVVISAHLEPFAGNAFRIEQLTDLMRQIHDKGIQNRVVIGADTNMLSARQIFIKDQSGIVRNALSSIGLVDPGMESTHDFQGIDTSGKWLSKMLRQRLVPFLIGRKHRLDVVATNMPILESGVFNAQTISDHDIAWSAINIG